MILIDARGEACPLPVVKTLQAIRSLQGNSDTIETCVDNEIAVQNLQRLAGQMKLAFTVSKDGEGCYRVTMTVPGGVKDVPRDEAVDCRLPEDDESVNGARRRPVVAIGSAAMGEGSEELGKTLMKGFIYALTQQEVLPSSILFYNGGASLTCEGSPALEDLKELEGRGVEILTCGTCLNFYGIAEKLAVGGVTNMYAIVEALTGAAFVIKP